MKQNITLAIEAELLKSARAFAAHQGTSISAMLADELRTKIEKLERYEQAKRAALALLDQPWSLRGKSMADRDTLHDRASLR